MSSRLKLICETWAGREEIPSPFNPNMRAVYDFLVQWDEVREMTLQMTPSELYTYSLEIDEDDS